ncbi:MAG: NAD(P)-dependent oxidoreductase [Pseudomonadota bacterium]|nr:NAD(P)-dependent oxidoreductase [Pseudomonadota bacterium]
MIDSRAPYPTLTGLGARRLVEGPWRIAVAGAGGWMGLAALEELHGLLGGAFHRRVVCFGSDRRRLSLRGGLVVEQQPLSELARLAPAPTLVLHLAFLTQEKAGLMPRGDYIAVNRAISDQVFEALGPIGAEGVFVASSGAVELAKRPDANPNKALYGALKLEDEARFSAWANERGKRTVIARIFGLAGPYINKLDSYALACFIADVLAGRPIAIEAAGPVFRSYVAVDELMSVSFGLLTDGTVGATLFDTAGKRGYEMAEIAEGVALAMGHPRGILRPPMTSAETDRYVGDGTLYESLRHELGVEEVGFRRQVRETAKFMAENSLAV